MDNKWNKIRYVLAYISTRIIELCLFIALILISILYAPAIILESIYEGYCKAKKILEEKK